MIKKRLFCIGLIICLCLSFANISFAYSYMDSENYIDLKKYGAKGDGVTDDSDALQSAIDALSSSHDKGVIYVPAGQYVLQKKINLAQGVTISGAGAGTEFIIRGRTDNNGVIFAADYVDNIALEKFSVTSECEITLFCLWSIGCNNVRMEKLKAYGLLFGRIAGERFDDGTYDIAKNAYVIDNYADGKGGSAGNYYGASSCIQVRYFDNAVITGNKIENCGHGIVWWGGDSNHTRDGAPENERYAKNIVISNNIVTNVTGGGIWGSMGENLVITNNVVTHAHDVGIDVEGCYYSTIANNVVYECTNGGIATFFFCRGTVISGNTVYSDTPKQYAVKIYNASQTIKNEDITVVGNTFINTSSSGGYVGGNNCEKIVYENNNFVNVFVDQKMNNSRYTKITGNHFIIDKAMDSAFYAIHAGTTHKKGELIVSDNIIESYEQQPEGSIGIYAIQSDGSNVSSNIISGNIVRGFETEVATKNTSTRTKHSFVISDNVFDKASFSNEGNSSVRYFDNYTSQGKYALGDIPTSGYWQKGQIIYFNSPDMEGYTGAVCVEEGEPGVWKYFGKY